MTSFILVSSGTPVTSSREWTTALAPNNRGGWNFITQGQTNDGKKGDDGVDPLHVDWFVVDLNLETCTVYGVDTSYTRPVGISGWPKFQIIWQVIAKSCHNYRSASVRQIVVTFRMTF